MIQFCIRAVPAAHCCLSEARLRTLGSPLIALLMQAQGGAASEGSTTSSTSIVRLVAEIQPHLPRAFCCCSCCCRSFRGASSSISCGRIAPPTKHTAQFLDVFRRSNKFSEVQAVCRSLGDSPLVGLFQSGYAELTAQLRQAAPDASQRTAIREPPAGRPTLKSLTAVDRALMRASVVEINKLERRVSFLATTASIAPFVGLFGTVWGIIIAFDRISQTGSTNLAVVAPGIADALIATGGGTLRGDSGGVLLQPAVTAREAVRVGNGRLRDGVSEHRRKELHVRDAESSSQQRRRRAPRPAHRQLAGRNQRRAARRRDAGAADHLHDHGADDSARHRRQSAGRAPLVADRRRTHLRHAFPSTTASRTSSISTRSRFARKSSKSACARKWSGSPRRRCSCEATAVCSTRN